MEEETAASTTPQKISELDRMVLEVARSNKRATQARAEKALAENQTAELSYRYAILQLYMKYGLTPADAISEDGSILVGGATVSQGQ